MLSQTQRVYNQYYPNNVDLFKDRLMELQENSELILDAGCGDGRIFNYELKENAKTIFGVDWS
jgi:cyclopropane fatty-acyl-phospholipid synthase-like methyltransferase